MKPTLEKISKLSDASFYYKTVDKPYFTAPWHFHPEIEILLIQKGYGTRYLGDSVENFFPGDLVLIGSNTPHVWSCSKDFYNNKKGMRSNAICIQFEENFWGEAFSGLPELHKINHLLFKAKRGIKFIGDTRKELERRIEKIPSQLGVKRIINLLSILDIMSSSPDLRFLSSPNYKTTNINIDDTSRMEIIHQYVMDNFTTNISLHDVSQLVNITPHSFCRYFKSRTNKVFSQFVNEVRIGHACQLLIESQYNVAQVCFEAGFNHLSNFNRQFKKIKHMTPTEFQLKYLGRNIDQINE